MGMYDNINFEIECPRCKNKVNNFQSKDNACGLHTLDFWEVNNFYSNCHKCGCWIEFNIKIPRPNKELSIRDYTMTVTYNDLEDKDGI